MYVYHNSIWFFLILIGVAVVLIVELVKSRIKKKKGKQTTTLPYQ